MAEAGAGVALEFVLKNLISLLSGEIKLVRGFEDDLLKLQKSLGRAQEFLSDAGEKEIKDRAVKEWLKDLEDVALEADDVLDELNYHLLQKKLKNEKQEKRKVSYSSSSSSTSTGLLFRRKMARKINDLNNKFDKINKVAESKGLEKMVVTAPDASTVGLDQETNSYSIESNVVGRESDVAKIVEMVLNAPLDEKISVLPIVGMGGLGKTTLTRQIYHHKKLESRFEKKIWICVSLNFDELTLFRNIHTILTGESVQLHFPLEDVLQKIHKLLESKRYLIILDDVWNEDSKKWEDFMKSLLGISTAMQNVIVVTTRLERVASLVKTLPIYKLASLSDVDCWSIIKAKTSKAETLSSIDELLEYEEIGKQFAHRCGGLPLAAHVIGGMLCGQPKGEWSSILKNELSNLGRDDDNHVMKILKVSYNRLPSSLLKKCFIYCSVFPQDYEINKNSLIEQWMGEGFLQTNQANVSMEVIGNKIFNHLMQASLLQESKRDDLGNITYCSMHDFVHDLACSVSGAGATKDSGNHVNKVRYMYLQSHEQRSKEQIKYLRTLIVDGEILDSMFPEYSQLRVLKLSKSSVQVPIKIEKQIHMRFLAISGSITKLPDSINKLTNLQTLVVPHLQNLPNTIIDLPNLRHLYISSIELPPFIGNLTSLQTLPYYTVGNDDGCKIGELKNLKYLSGTLEISNLERVKDKGEAGHADLFGKPGISTLVLDWTRTGEGDKNAKDVLDGLQPHPNLKCLKIRGYGSITFPSWTMKMTVHNAIECRSEALTNLVNIKIEYCQCEKLPTLGHLQHLKFLTFSNLPAVQSIGLSFYGLEDCSAVTTIDNVNTPEMIRVFPALQKLCVIDMENLTEWVNVESRVETFPCLEKLKIESCPKLESAPTRFPRLKKLIIRRIGSNFPLTKICANTSSLQKLVIRSYPGIINFGDECFVKNRDLSFWYIEDCPNMMYIEQDSSTLHGFPSLKDLYIFNCPLLKSIPNFDLRSLEALFIKECPSLTYLPHELLESCTPSLESLALGSLPRLENMNTVTSSISRMSLLQYLFLLDLPLPTNLQMEIPQLRGLEIGRFSEPIDVDSFNDNLKSILHKSHRLEWLELFGNENWGSLPDCIQHLHDLNEFSLDGYGIEALPEWIENLSFLKSLSVRNCERLRHLPSKETMQRLTNLWISNCPLLIENIRAQQETTPDGADSSEWSKISHIKNVCIDGNRMSTQNSTAQAPPVQDKKKFAGCFPFPQNKKH